MNHDEDRDVVVHVKLEQTKLIDPGTNQECFFLLKVSRLLSLPVFLRHAPGDEVHEEEDRCGGGVDGYYHH